MSCCSCLGRRRRVSAGVELRQAGYDLSCVFACISKILLGCNNVRSRFLKCCVVCIHLCLVSAIWLKRCTHCYCSLCLSLCIGEFCTHVYEECVCSGYIVSCLTCGLDSCLQFATKRTHHVNDNCDAIRGCSDPSLRDDKDMYTIGVGNRLKVSFKRSAVRISIDLRFKSSQVRDIC